MPLVVAMSEIPAHKINQPGSNAPGSPGGESRYSAAHFHEVDQFQVIMEGSGDFGRHPVKPYSVHFARAYTPYGPLQSDKGTSWGFMFLRSRLDSGAQRFPGSLAKLKRIPNRKPWQATAEARFPQAGSAVSTMDVPDSWSYPDCSAGKNDFQMVEV